MTKFLCREDSESEAPGEEEGSSWMADHALSHHRGKISADVTQDFEFFVVGSSNKPLYRQLEEIVRIRVAKTRGILILGREEERLSRCIRIFSIESLKTFPHSSSPSEVERISLKSLSLPTLSVLIETS